MSDSDSESSCLPSIRQCRLDFDTITLPHLENNGMVVWDDYEFGGEFLQPITPSTTGFTNHRCSLKEELVGQVKVENIDLKQSAENPANIRNSGGHPQSAEKEPQSTDVVVKEQEMSQQIVKSVTTNGGISISDKEPFSHSNPNKSCVIS
uniref:Uncharacterized protein n=1 Tax=Spongospora subterranea TaxID=70186 RepID=A0A0H5QID2_9EUKA|eukprot:CRZ01392.1 hypothetical protein [Spongospora subterranea]